MPVGRIEVLHMVPMNFEEFLRACGETKLQEILRTFTPDHPMSELQHSRFLELQAQYFYVCGTPEAVKEFSIEKNFRPHVPSMKICSQHIKLIFRNMD